MLLQCFMHLHRTETHHLNYIRFSSSKTFFLYIFIILFLTWVLFFSPYRLYVMASLTSPQLWPLTRCRRSWPSVRDQAVYECILYSTVTFCSFWPEQTVKPLPHHPFHHSENMLPALCLWRLQDKIRKLYALNESASWESPKSVFRLKFTKY